MTAVCTENTSDAPAQRVEGWLNVLGKWAGLAEQVIGAHIISLENGDAMIRSAV